MNNLSSSVEQQNQQVHGEETKYKSVAVKDTAKDIANKPAYY
jgi:hypothetical protein